MATITATWTENVTLRAAATLAAAGVATHDIDLATNGYDRVDVQVDVVIGSSTGVTVRVYGSPDSGTTVDDQPLLVYSISADDTRTLVLTGAYRQISLTNDDGTNATGNITILYAGRKWTSA